MNPNKTAPPYEHFITVSYTIGITKLAGPEGAGDGLLELDLVKVTELSRVEVGRIKTKSTVSDPVGNRDL
ncbi:hypothetical protein [Acetobacterium wieringae]|uniref:hypothetical protein n=1 Tax=Acetobacterium wieringae TaxID=52694 RepID=UPI000878C9DD|nr:hypothetical protein [Acetobacterium wieringae]